MLRSALPAESRCSCESHVCGMCGTCLCCGSRLTGFRNFCMCGYLLLLLINLSASRLLSSANCELALKEPCSLVEFHVPFAPSSLSFPRILRLSISRQSTSLTETSCFSLTIHLSGHCRVTHGAGAGMWLCDSPCKCMQRDSRQHDRLPMTVEKSCYSQHGAVSTHFLLKITHLPSGASPIYSPITLKNK
jgi:hypothetical protein